jgi:hypothetical protein
MKRMAILVSVLTVIYFVANFAFADLNDGLIAYYPFDGNADDASVNGLMAQQLERL